jgi:broad specificity phosphatase PhoE
MTTVYIIRHAEKEKNKGEFRVPGLPHPDQPLSQRGWEQSRQLWDYLCDKEIAAIYVSRYQRTGQTIEYAAKQLGITPVMDDRLNELDSGVLDPMSDEEIREKYPEFWKAYTERTADFRFPGGETGEEACRRIAGFLEEKREAHPDKNIVFVTHEGLIRQLMCYIVDIPVYKRGNFYVDLCGITEITYQPKFNNWKLIRFNQKLL